MPVTVGTSTAASATDCQFQRKTFYANGYYWEFYSDGTNLVYRTSTDAITWSSATTVRACTDGDHVDVGFFPDYNSSYVYYVYANGGTNSAWTFCRGTISGNTITWGTEYNVQSASAFLQYTHPSVVVLSDGSVHTSADRGTSTNHYCRDYSNPNNDGSGTWTSQGNLSPQSTSSTDQYHNRLMALTSTKAYIIYAISSPAYGRLWNGTAWEAQETITNIGNVHLSACSEGDNVHLAYYASTPSYTKAYRLRTYGTGWGSQETIRTMASVFDGITICVDTGTGDLYAFWGEREGSPNYYYNVLYSEKPSGGSWGSAVILAANEPNLTYLSVNVFKRVWNNVIGVTWTKGEAPGPYDVRYATLSIVVIKKAVPSSIVPLMRVMDLI